MLYETISARRNVVYLRTNEFNSKVAEVVSETGIEFQY